MSILIGNEYSVMLKDILYKTLLLAAVGIACAACSQEDGAAAGAGGGEGVSIQVRIADAAATRATEDGWGGDWNENAVTRLDFFQFAADGTLKRHLLPSDMPSFEGQNAVFHELGFNGLAYSDLANNPTDVFYLVANCPQLATERVETLADLQAVMITPALDVDARRQSFVMDAKTTSDDTGLYIVDESNEKITLRFELYRAAAKVRVSVRDAAGAVITGGCQYCFVNYVSTGTSVLAESEAYGEGGTAGTGGGQRRESMADCAGAALTYAGADGDMAVFYSYPNSWFDEAKVGGGPGSWTIDSYVTEDPIVSGKQTCIVLKAPFNGVEYYYKVPVNYATYKNNDAVSFTDEQLEEIRSLYRIDRNSIYDVTVTVDRVGGPVTDPVTPRFHIRVNDWQKGGDYNIGQGEFE